MRLFSLGMPEELRAALQMGADKMSRELGVKITLSEYIRMILSKHTKKAL